MDRLQQVEVFVRVAETASFSRAAELLDLPRSTVSTLIQTLEARLGVRLLDRTTRRVTLTLEGEVYLRRAQRLLMDFEETESSFRGSSAELRGRLRVNVPARIGRLIVAPALSVFFARYPAIELELGSTDRAVDLVQEGIDCALRIGRSSDALLIAQPLGMLPLINCASPAYLARYGTPHTIADLASHYAVHYVSPATGQLDEWEVMTANGQSQRVTMPSKVTVNNAETYLACCLAGLGLIQIPAYDVQDELRSGQLVEVMPNATAAPMPISLLYLRRRHESRLLHVFMDWMLEILADPLQLQSQ